MLNGSKDFAKVLLKCRATDLQLKDRIEQPVPAGLELYLDLADISGEDWHPSFVERIQSLGEPDDFVYVIEGPLRSLDGSFFDLTSGNPAHEEVVRRVVALGREIGAKAAVLHCISVGNSIENWSTKKKKDDLEKARSFLEKYVTACTDNGMIPTIENVPPVARMREERFLFSSIGVEPEDLVWLTDGIAGLKVTLDVSHGQLYVNAANTRPADATSELSSLVDYYRARPGPRNMDEFISALGSRIINVHVSNASGILAEGLPYSEGDLDIDSLIARLATISQFIVTETIEPDANNAVLMREAQSRINATIEILAKRN